MANNSCNFYQISTPLSGETCFYSGAGNTNDDCRSRMTSKECTTQDQETISNIIKDAINQTGVEVNYYVHTYNVSGADNIYGEHSQSRYHAPKTFIMYIELDEDAISYSKFGLRSDDTITAYVHISSFADAFIGDSIHVDNGQYVEPKADDVFELTEYGSTRPNGRGPKQFIVTERMDSDINNMNPLGGHYTWRLRAKRFEWSFEPGLSGEDVTNQVFDNSFFGRLSGGDNEKTEDKQYDHDIDDISKDRVFDMNNNDTSPYGTYG